MTCLHRNRDAGNLEWKVSQNKSGTSQLIFICLKSTVGTLD